MLKGTYWEFVLVIWIVLNLWIYHVVLNGSVR